MGLPVEHSKLLIWSKGTDYDTVRDTTDTDKINFINPINNHLDGMLYETNAFVDGLVPYGDLHKIK